ncbi:hypothetical protein B0J13DRAFT_576611 [Dactylonectria estremocensis]|uniref:Uncharacterized protein n=1 Tax=Dactylonectria estremocensis TaxID=1079267 RepID=A0A9P9D1D1_9HYPO|nr:hypothetical protein B0J13DRAFT_576611 [Dactylonectria estremocensis]
MRPKLVICGLFVLLNVAHGLNFLQCQEACRSGDEAMQQFCRQVSEPALRALCWSVSVGLHFSRLLKICENTCWAITGG